MTAKLSTWVTDLEIEEVTYEKRSKHSVYIAPDYDDHPKDIKNDVYALGISIMKAIGVSHKKLVSFKMSSDIMHQETVTQNVESKLKNILLRTVDPNYTNRLTASELRDRLKEIVQIPNALKSVNMNTLCKEIENTAEFGGQYMPIGDEIVPVEDTIRVSPELKTLGVSETLTMGFKISNPTQEV